MADVVGKHSENLALSPQLVQSMPTELLQVDQGELVLCTAMYQPQIYGAQRDAGYYFGPDGKIGRRRTTSSA